MFVKIIWEKAKSLYKTLKNKKGFSTQDIAVGMTMAVMVGTVATVTANSVVLDTEEKVHIFNATTMADAAKQLVVDDNLKIDLDATRTITLQQLYDREKITPINDPSAEDLTYHAAESLVVILNEESDDGSQKLLRFYAKLVRDAGDYTYTDQTDLVGLDTPVETKDLSLDEVDIPARDVAE